MRQFRRLSTPDRAHPLVRRLVEEMNKQRIGVLDMAERSGVNKNTFKEWRTRTVPTIDNIEACFTVLGYRLTIARDDEGRNKE